MKKVNILSLLLAFIFITFHTTSVFGWKKNNHVGLSEVATKSSILAEKNGNFTQSNLGLESGLNATVAIDTNQGDGLSPMDMIQRGAENEDAWCWQEDDLSCFSDEWGRFNHHFHNPYEKDWEDAGLSDSASGMSSLLWAQDDEQSWSWNNIRDIYYEALTSPDLSQSERRLKLARTFMGIGHQMHLIQDMAVPAHTRNDAHPTKHPFESWSKYVEGKDRMISSLAHNQIRPNLDLMEDYENEDVLPVGKLIDTKAYDGTNPSADLSIGLSEFTNANFFSSDTIFAKKNYSEGDEHYFPYPRRSDTNIDKFIEEDLPPRRKQSGDTEFVISLVSDRLQIDHFVQPTYHTRPLDSELPIYEKTFYLSENCHKDYVEKLVPRASGYSTELINYFFRGRIDISLPDSGVYAMLDPDTEVDSDNYDNVENVFNSISVKANNTSLYDEQLNDGTIELVIKYKKVLNYPFQDFSNMSREYSDYHYTVIESDRQDIPNNPVTMNFDLSHDPIPLNAVDLSLYLVYRGQIGAEDNGVAVGYKDISEPTPFAVYNTCDNICMNGQWYKAGNEEAIDIVDQNNDGYANPYYCNENQECYKEEHDVYQHASENICLLFHPRNKGRYPDCSRTNEKKGKLFIDHLEPGKAYRCFILSDIEFGYTANRSNMVLPEAHTHCPPSFPYTDYSWGHGRWQGGTYNSLATKHSYSTKHNRWTVPLFFEKYTTNSFSAYWLHNNDYPDNSTDGKSACDFEDL